MIRSFSKQDETLGRREAERGMRALRWLLLQYQGDAGNSSPWQSSWGKIAGNLYWLK